MKKKVWLKIATAGLLVVLLVFGFLAIKTAWLTKQAQNMTIPTWDNRNTLEVISAPSSDYQSVLMTPQLLSELYPIFRDMKYVHRCHEKRDGSIDLGFKYLTPQFYANGFIACLEPSLIKNAGQFYTCSNYHEILERILAVVKSHSKTDGNALDGNSS